MWRPVMIPNHICVHVTSRDAHVRSTMSPLCRIFSTSVTCVRDLHLRWRFYKSWLTTKSENLVGKATWEAAFQIVVLHRLTIKDFFFGAVSRGVCLILQSSKTLPYIWKEGDFDWLTRPNQMPLMPSFTGNRFWKNGCLITFLQLHEVTRAAKNSIITQPNNLSHMIVTSL